MLTRREMPRAMVADMLGRLAIALGAGIDLRRAWQMEIPRVPAAWRPRMEMVARSLALMPVLTPYLAAASMLTVKAVCMASVFSSTCISSPR